MTLETRLPEPTNIKDPELRRYLNELIRTLRELETFPQERVEDAVADLVSAVNDITITYDDQAGVLTFDVSIAGAGTLTTAQTCALIEGHGYLSADQAWTTADSCAVIEAYDFITSQEASARFLTTSEGNDLFMSTAETCTLIENHGYASIDSTLTTAQTCALIEGHGYLSADQADVLYMTTTETCTLIESYNYLVSVSNVSAGTYGTSTIIPQIVVDTAGLITDIVRVTSPVVDESFITISAENGGVVSASSGNTKLNIRGDEGNISTSTCAEQAILKVQFSNNSGFLTSADTDGVYTTTAETCTIVEAYDYIVSTCAVSGGTYGTSTIIPQITVGNDGRITDIVRVSSSGSGGLDPAGCSVYQTTGTSVASGTWTTLDFDTEEYDDDGWHDNVTNNSRITFDFTGRVQINALYNIGSTGNQDVGIRIRLNGSTIVAREFRDDGAMAENGQISTSTSLAVSANDYIEVQGYQANGSQTSGTGPAGTKLQAHRIF